MKDIFDIDIFIILVKMQVILACESRYKLEQGMSHIDLPRIGAKMIGAPKPHIPEKLVLRAKSALIKNAIVGLYISHFGHSYGMQHSICFVVASLKHVLLGPYFDHVVCCL